MSSASIIPNDLILSILCNLPLKSLVRFTAACRSWSHDIRSPMFISSHLNKTLSITNKDHESQLFLLIRLDRKGGLCHVYMDKENDKAMTECERFDFPFGSKEVIPFGSDSTPFDVIGSCNGVVCLFNHCSFSIILWNPSIRKYLTIAQPQTRILYCYPPDGVAFGFDSTTGDFKVLNLRAVRVDVMQAVNVMQAEVYSLINGSWRIIAGANRTNGGLRYQLCGNRNKRETCCVNDSLHWIAFHGKYHIHPFSGFILVFDLRSELFREFSLPHPHGNGYQWSIHEHGESSIAAFDSNHVTDIWVMKEYGVEDSWAKMWSFNPRKMEVSKTLKFRKNRELLVESAGGTIMSLDLDVQQGKLVIESTPRFNQISVQKHVQSLILFDKGEDVTATTYPATFDDIYDDFWSTTLLPSEDNRGLKRCKRFG